MKNKLKNHTTEIINLYLAGQGSDAIAKQFNVNPNSILKLLRRNKVERRKPVSKTSNEDKSQILEMYQNGISAPKIAKLFKISPTIVARILKKNNIQLRNASQAHRIYKINEEFLDNIDSEEKAYFLGFFFADGNTSKNKKTISIEASYTDVNILEKLKLLFYYEGDKNLRSNSLLRDKKVIKTYILNIHSKKINQRMVELGAEPNKTFKIKYPNIDPSLNRHFIRGLFDGDGGFYFSETSSASFQITSTNQILESVRSVLEQECNIEFSEKSIHSVGNVFNFGFTGAIKIEKILDYFYKDSSIYLDRKYNKYLEFKKWRNNEIISSSKFTTEFDDIFKYNGNSLTKDFISTLSIDEKQNITKHLISIIRSQGWRQPRILDHLQNDFKSLINYNPDLTLNTINNNSSLATNICKTFCSEFFYSKRKGSISLFEAFHDDQKLEKAILNRMGIGNKEIYNISYKSILRGMVSAGISANISMFKPTIAKYMALKYCPENGEIFDYSAGWGGRMLGTIAANRKYTGVDPLNIPDLKLMAKFLSIDVNLIEACSENICLNKKFDLIWSSPPYFDTEIYSNDLTQAYSQGEEYFYNVYWKNTLNNCKQMLKENGYFGVNIKNQPKMLEITVEIFGEIYEKIEMISSKNHLVKNKNHSSNEFIYIFKSK